MNHGINGKDSLTITNATINWSGGGDTLRSTNDSDATLGYVTVTDSTLDPERRGGRHSGGRRI